MEKTASGLAALLKFQKKQILSYWLPYLILLVGISMSVLLSYDLFSQHPSERFFYTPNPEAQPWITLIIGILISLLCASAIRIIQLIHEHSKLLVKIKQDFNHEITQHLQIEENQKKLEIALLEGQKLQAIGTLAGGIAHDFNNILYAINGYVEMAREDVPEDSLVHKNLGRVLEATQRGQELVSRILDFGRRNQRYEQKPMPIAHILDNVLALLKPTIPSSVSIHVTDNMQDFTILGNQTQLHQVLVNIINNSVDAMYGEGNINIETEILSPDDQYLKQFPNVSNASYCKITITDTGHGMDQNTLKRIFEPFYTTKEVGKGTGLGLATVHGIIAQHHGEITVSSQLGVGTTFTILLPEHKDMKIKTEDFYGNYTISGR